MPVGSGEDEAVILINCTQLKAFFGLCNFVLSKRFHRQGCKRYFAARASSLGLRVCEPVAGLLERATHGKFASIEINIGPTEPEEFAAS